MIILRKSGARGFFDHGWFATHHTFSFDQYQDPSHMGFRKLRVINEDRVQPSQGFPLHFHRDMEILSFVLSGALEHEDSQGNRAVVGADEIQKFSAGTGIQHSERNPSPTEPNHFLQIWIHPAEKSLPPDYQQKKFPREERRNTLQILASPDGRNGSVSIAQDVLLYAGLLESGEELSIPLDPGRHGWLQMISGELLLNDQPLGTGDGAAISEEDSLLLACQTESEFLFFDLA